MKKDQTRKRLASKIFDEFIKILIIFGRFSFNPKFRKFRLVHNMEQTISVWSYRNIRY